MRYAMLLVSLAIALAVGGGIMFYASLKPAGTVIAYSSPPMVVSSGEVRHPVSKATLLQASLMSEKTAPFFKVQDSHGKIVQIGGQGKNPQFVYFILDGCPCSMDAQPLFNRLYQRFKGKVDFIGVINTADAKAVDYAGVQTVLHPVVSDEHLKIIRAYGAKESTYNLIIRPNGAIEKLWPGYSQDILQDINARLAKLTGTPVEPFDASLAPKKVDSGCFF